MATLPTDFCEFVELDLLDTATGSLETVVSRTGRTARKMGATVQGMGRFKVDLFILKQVWVQELRPQMQSVNTSPVIIFITYKPHFSLAGSL